MWQLTTTAIIVVVVWSIVGVWMIAIAIACLCCTKERRSALKRRVTYLQNVSVRSKVLDNSYLNIAVPPADEQATHTYVNELADTEAGLSFDINEVFEKTVRKTANSYCIQQRRLIIGKVIGQGQFGVVFRGQLLDKSLKNPVDVAIKTVQGERCNEKDVSSFLEEVLRMKGFGHHNVLSMIGLVLKDSRPFVILPFMDGGDIKSYVADPEQSFTVKDLLEIGTQIADGMSYLAERGFIHRDLAARNCMIDSKGTVKIADFGLSRDIFDADYYKLGDLTQPLPVKWMAVESLTSHVFTHQSDVWSFGVVLWELMVRGCTPYPGMDNPTVMKYVKSGQRLAKPASAPDEIYDIMTRCWRAEPTKRPTFAELSEQLHDIISDNEHRKKSKRKKAKHPNHYYNIAVKSTQNNLSVA